MRENSQVQHKDKVIDVLVVRVVQVTRVDRFPT